MKKINIIYIHLTTLDYSFENRPCGSVYKIQQFSMSLDNFMSWNSLVPSWLKV